MLPILKRNIPAIILFVFFLSLYVYTAAPGVYDGDSGEIAAAVNELGLAHPTGFPLYMLTGKLFTILVPIKDVAYRLNIFSSLLTASALIFFLYTLKNLGTSQFSAFVASFVLGLGRNTIWSNAGSASVYALSLLFVTILFFIYSKWREKQNTKYLYLYGFLWGLSLGTHVLMLILGIPLLFMLWQARMTLRTRTSVLLKTIFVTGIPFIQYLYLPFAYRRSGIINWGSMETFNDFLYYITQRQYAVKMFARTFNETMNFIKEIGSLLTSEFTILFFIIALFGFLVLHSKNKKFFWILALMSLANIGMMLGYGNKDGDLVILFRYIFITDVVLALAIAFSLDEIMNLVGALKNSKRLALFSLCIVAVVLFQFTQSYAANDRRHNYLIEDTASNILRTVEPNAIILAYVDHITGPLWYLQSIGYRKDVIIVAQPGMSHNWYISNMIDRYPDVFYGESLLDIEGGDERLRVFIKNNLSYRTIYSVFNSLGDSEAKKDFDLIPQGLLSRIIPKDIDSNSLVVNNENIWESYTLRDVKAGSHTEESLDFLIKTYALALYSGGIAYYDQGLIDESLDMLRKSLEIFVHPVTQKNFDYIIKVRDSR